MPQTMLESAHANLAALSTDQAAGEGIVIGLTPDGGSALQVYWRRGGDLPAGAGSMRTVPAGHLMTNGNYITAMADAMAGDDERTFDQAFKSSVEGLDGPDVPHLAALLAMTGDSAIPITYRFAVAREDVPDGPGRSYRSGHVPSGDSASGHCVNTYLVDGRAPGFDAHPYDVLPLGEDVDSTAELYVERLGAEAELFVAAKGIHLASGRVSYRVTAS